MGVQRHLVPVVGHEPSDAADFAAYFRDIVTAMRSVPGAAFRFVWNPTSGPEP